MIKFCKMQYGRPTSERVIDERKTLYEAIRNSYQDNWCDIAYFYTNRNLCGHRNTCTLCELDNVRSLIRIKVLADEKDCSQIFKAISDLRKMGCKINVVYEDFLEVYVKEVSKQ